MEKPLSIKAMELKTELTRVINNTDLPACMVDMIVQQFASTIHMSAAQIEEAERKAYTEALVEEADRQHREEDKNGK